MKMFGQLTRTVKPFYPARLLCKRFNVRNPHPDHDPSRNNVGHTMAGSKEALSEEKVEDMMRQRGQPKVFEQWANDPALSAVIPKPSERAPAQTDINETNETSETTATATTESAPVKQTEGAKEEEDQQQEKETYERPSMDIFKAIFENSEDEDEEMEDRDKVQEPANAESQGMTETRQPISNQSSRHDDDNDEDQDDVMVGPLPPPQPSAQEQEQQPSAPKFTHASERHSESTSRHLDTKMNIVSESIVVQPFKARERVRRRHVSVSEEEEESDHEERRSRHKKKHKKEERRHKKDKKKKEKSRKKHSKHHHSSDEDMLDGAVWVEKDVPQSSTSYSASHKRRARATDLW